MVDPKIEELGIWMALLEIRDPPRRLEYLTLALLAATITLIAEGSILKNV
ncbi:MAG: hypothetical protein ACE5Z5_06385 [Candidatus Bathyarchaeia archaeon]